jgi:probable HAF family extracellular repeat protein
LPIENKNFEWIVATAINDHGQVAGSCEISKRKHRAFFWDPKDGIKYIYGPGWGRCFTRDINNVGQVVGSYQDITGTWYHFFWDPDKGLTDITVSGRFSTMVHLNDSGQVVGSAPLLQPDGLEVMHAFIWDVENGLKDIGVGILADKVSGAVAINDSGKVIGVRGAKIFSYDGGFIWDSQSTIPIKEFDIGTDQFNTISDINNAGQIVGHLGEEKTHAFVWDPEDGLLDLADLVGEHSIAMHINQSGHVLGTIWAPDETRLLLGKYRAPPFLQRKYTPPSRFVFRPPDDVIYLDKELGFPFGSFSVNDINARGVILVYHYTKYKSLIMTPIENNSEKQQ